MPILGRRKLLVTGGAATLTLSLATLATTKRARADGPWGPLVPDPDGIFDLPAGFSYQILETTGDPMDDGYRVPGRPDGMACFAGPDGTLILMRNHENFVNDADNGPYASEQAPPPEAYEPAAMGGVTRVVLDASSFARISSNLVLAGTIRNCAGGPSPWGWLSCEETIVINGGGEYRHGYTFACPIDASTVQPPQRIDGYGRFNHEAVAINPQNNVAYLTEDRLDSCLYRFVPDVTDQPFVGRLQALKVQGLDNHQTAALATDDGLAIEWVDIDEPDPDEDTVRAEAQAKGAALFMRGEGIWFFGGHVYICTTNGGPIGAGQIFRLYDSMADDPATLWVIATATLSNSLRSPDNITVAPWGEVFIAEDGNGVNHLRWVTAEGEVCTFGRNALSGSELAGVCFSPDGRALFVNMQHDGLTLVVTGPFPGGQDDDDDGDSETTGDDSGETGGETGDGGGDELGGDTTGDAGEGPGIEGDDGCGCTTADAPTGAGALLTGLGTVAAAAWVKHDESPTD